MTLMRPDRRAGEVLALTAELSADRILKLRAYVGNPEHRRHRSPSLS